MGRPKSDIDPKRVNLEGKRKRGRKLRDRPEPLQSQKDGEAEALARVRQLPVNPGVMLEPSADGWLYTPPHNDRNLWELEVAASLGTRSPSVVNVFLRDLRRLAGTAWDADLKRWKADETELNAALGMVADWQPENTAQAALAAQAVAVHWMMIRLAAQALNGGGMVMDRDAALAAKLARTYAQLCETMQGLKGKRRTARQSISVSRQSHHHQHIHVHRDGGAAETDSQCDATTEKNDGTAERLEDLRAVSGEDEGGQVVRLPRRGR